MNTYLVSRDLNANPEAGAAYPINAPDAEGAAERFATLFMDRLETSVVCLAVRDVRDRFAGLVTVEITPTRNGPPEVIAIGSRRPVENTPTLPVDNGPAIRVGTASAAV